MRVIICGAGQVGQSIAAYLSKEENDVTVIDTNPVKIAQINNDLDVKGVVGHASNPDVLNDAGANDADMIIAVTHSDEINMVACQVAHSLFSVPKKIARIREQAYLQPAWSNLFARAHLPIDVVISPEIIVANDIYRRLSVPGTTYVSPMADGLMHLVGVVCAAECPVVETRLSELGLLFPDLCFKIIAVLRQGKPIITDDDDHLQVGDEVYFIVDTKHLKRTMVIFGHEEPEARRIVIAGGGNVGYGLIQLLQERGRGVNVKVIERNEQRAKFLSENLDNIVILNGSLLDRDILEESSINMAETFIGVTNDDESNILGSLLAKQYGCKRTITLVNNTVYTSLVNPLGVDAIVLPRSTIVATIMQHVRRGRIKGLHSLRDGFAEVIEAEVSDTSPIANTPISDLDLPHEIVVAAVVRNNEVHIPEGDFIIKPEDHVIVIASQSQVRSVEKMFTVQVDLF
jgi:trk system potassium uptake protein TrkA